jgi:hypothetical protein
MESPKPDSAKARIGQYLLDKIKNEGRTEFLYEELLGISGAGDLKNIRLILRSQFYGMFGAVKKGTFAPKYEDFDGKEGFLEYLREAVDIFSNTPNRERHSHGGNLADRMRV